MCFWLILSLSKHISSVSVSKAKLFNILAQSIAGNTPGLAAHTVELAFYIYVL